MPQISLSLSGAFWPMNLKRIYISRQIDPQEVSTAWAGHLRTLGEMAHDRLRHRALLHGQRMTQLAQMPVISAPLAVVGERGLIDQWTRRLEAVHPCLVERRGRITRGKYRRSQAFPVLKPTGGRYPILIFKFPISRKQEIGNEQSRRQYRRQYL